MAKRKKVAPAELRTIGLFSGLTPLEEAANVATADEAKLPPADRSYAGTRDALVSSAIRWLGLDLFADDGDDVTLAVHPQGHAVLNVTHGGKGCPGRTTQVKLSPQHVKKLRELFRAP